MDAHEILWFVLILKTRRETWSTPVLNGICVYTYECWFDMPYLQMFPQSFLWSLFPRAAPANRESVSLTSKESVDFSVLCCSGCVIDGWKNNARGLQNLQYLKFPSRQVNYFWVMLWNQPGSVISLLVQEIVKIVWASSGTELPWLCLQLLAVSLLPVQRAAYLEWLLAAVELVHHKDIWEESARGHWKNALCYLVLVFWVLPRGVWVTNAI